MSFDNNIVLLHPKDTPSAAATNLAANTFLAVDDPNLRAMAVIAGPESFAGAGSYSARLLGRIGGSLAAATKIRIQYHPSGNPAVATGDAGWKTLLDSAGSHTLNTLFYTAPVALPSDAKTAALVLRAGLFGGDGVADPTLTCAILNLYE